MRKSLAGPAAETVQKGKYGENFKLAHAKHKHNAKERRKKKQCQLERLLGLVDHLS